MRDRISDLHENNICHILSRLPTKDAIRTSVLSKDWKYKWTSSYNVDLNTSDLTIKDEALKSFYDTMDRILVFSKQLKSFRLVHGRPWQNSSVQDWVSAMERVNLESFEISNSYYYPSDDVVYQVNFLSSTSLRKLKLEHRVFTLNVTNTNCAPNLTSLCLSGVRITNQSYKNTSVTFTFPVLETFEARKLKFSNVTCVEIYAPVLTKFFVELGLYEKKLDYSIVLVAPKLTTFESNGCLPVLIALKYRSSIVSASLLNDDAIYQAMSPINIVSRVGELLNGFTNLEELTLSFSIAKELLSGPLVHRHHKLKKLFFAKLRTGQQLLELLKTTPRLESLSVNVKYMRFYDAGGEYEEMSSVPSCIISHLETVEFKGFVRSKPCYNLAKFLLKNGETLKKFVIYRGSQETDINNVRKFFATLHKFRPDVRIDIDPLI